MTSGRRRLQPGVRGASADRTTTESTFARISIDGCFNAKADVGMLLPSVLLWRWGSMASALKLCPESTCENAISGPPNAVSAGIPGASGADRRGGRARRPLLESPSGVQAEGACVSPQGTERCLRSWLSLPSWAQLGLVGFGPTLIFGNRCYCGPGARHRQGPSLSQPLGCIKK